MFGPHPFERYSEMDVRENIIRPLLEKLGYSREMVTTQLSLRYQRLFLGHKKGHSKDRPLRGEADYIIDLDGRLRWVIEAKKPGEINDDDREQAYSYAMHPQVRAVVFAVISGTHFEVFSTFHKPESGALLAFTYEELPEQFQSLLNTVGPEGLRVHFPNHVIDTGKPLAPGLRSFAKVERGRLLYTEAPEWAEGIRGLIVHLTGGSLVRREEGGIMAVITPSFHNTAFVNFSHAINALEVELTTDDEVVSTNADVPTTFTGSRQLLIKKGTDVPSFVSIASTRVLMSVTANVEVVVTGFLRGKTFVGTLVARSRIESLNVPFQIGADIELTLS